MTKLKLCVVALLLCSSGVSLSQIPAEQAKPSNNANRGFAAVKKIEQDLFDRTEHAIKSLDLDLIMLGPDFAGTAPSEVSWAGDNSRLWFRWKRPGERDPGIFEVSRKGGPPRRLTKDEEGAAPPATADRDRSGRWALYEFEGDIHLLDTHSRKLLKITDSPETESDPRFLADSKKVTFRRGDNLYLLPLEGPSLLRQLTDLRSGKDPEAEKEKLEKEGQRKFLKDQQTELLFTQQTKGEKKKEDEERKKSRRPQPLFLEERKVESLSLSADEKYVAVVLSETPKDQATAQVSDYVTLSGYTEALKSRSKVGDLAQKTFLRILNSETGEWFEVTAPAGAQPDGKESASKKLELRFLDPVWSREGHRLVVTARREDNKEQWLLAIDVERHQSRSLDHQSDEAWVLRQSDCGFIAEDQKVWFRSEQTGFLHLYTVPWSGGDPKALTEGAFEVSDVMVPPDQGTFFLRANRDGPEVKQFYTLAIEGGVMQKLTTEPGNHQVTVSPDGRFLADVYSFSNKPWELFVQPRDNPKDRLALTESPTVAFKSYPWIDPKIIKVRARDGVDVPARLYVPPKPHPMKPAVIFVHGAGYLQNVHRWWSYYDRPYLFHHFLMEQGYTVLDLDYRGSAGYGRNWRTAIYRHMGGKDLEDHVDAVDYLVRQHGATPERVGIYGGSYGGFITLMALFTAPKSFGAGAALRPVTDWAHYNQGYTSDILNLPQNDEESYRRSSPIYFADGLEDPLLICHGIVDVNVHAQDTIRLAQRLIELRKPNFEVMLYPVEDHAFKESSSWADEYKRIFKLFEETLKRK